MKIRYLIPLLALVLIFSFGLACNGSKTIEVMYLVLGTTKNASVTYSNNQGGIEQRKINLAKGNPYKAMQNEESPVYKVKGLENFVNEETNGGIVEYDDFPLNEFLYISAQNEDSFGNIIVIIIVNNEIWKSSKSSGAYVIATASGIYEE